MWARCGRSPWIAEALTSRSVRSRARRSAARLVFEKISVRLLLPTIEATTLALSIAGLHPEKMRDSGDGDPIAGAQRSIRAL